MSHLETQTTRTVYWDTHNYKPVVPENAIQTHTPRRWDVQHSRMVWMHAQIPNLEGPRGHLNTSSGYWPYLPLWEGNILFFGDNPHPYLQRMRSLPLVAHAAVQRTTQHFLAHQIFRFSTPPSQPKNSVSGSQPPSILSQNLTSKFRFPKVPLSPISSKLSSEFSFLN